MKLRGFK